MSAILHQASSPLVPGDTWQSLETFFSCCSSLGRLLLPVSRAGPTTEICWVVPGLIDLVTAGETGAKGSPTKVNKVVIPPDVKRESLIFREETDAFMDALSSVLLEKGLV